VGLFAGSTVSICLTASFAGPDTPLLHKARHNEVRLVASSQCFMFLQMISRSEISHLFFKCLFQLIDSPKLGVHFIVSSLNLGEQPFVVLIVEERRVTAEKDVGDHATSPHIDRGPVLSSAQNLKARDWRGRFEDKRIERSWCEREWRWCCTNMSVHVRVRAQNYVNMLHHQRIQSWDSVPGVHITSGAT
jgi:hypothetical protein